MVAIRGGVEDTRLEAKAKDTQKIRGQGEALSHWAIFCNFLEKKAILMPLDLISLVFRAT